ncbi:uncharacterized protein B0H64DRAFT_382266 [Chaetomium fimeti]|uniref:Golgi apparatus membrane protein TVP38 n=1 Tax=Chaetomium fimeti TaxID=1854472 RepID=A0AAE0LX62_9PEZI|nr:hypothetical protein B0H64DRAFT_382266 [Chaetomium fimeti]
MPPPSEDDVFHDASSNQTASSPPTIITTRPSTDNDNDNDTIGGLNTSTIPPPPWTPRPTPPGARRLSTRRPGTATTTTSSTAPHKPFLTTAATTLTYLYRQYTHWYNALPIRYQILVSLAGLLILVLSILFLVYSHPLLVALGAAAQSWRAAPLGWLPLWLATVATAFPPVIGYSTCVTLAGFVYGFPLGWPIAASATVVGSAAAFVASRGWLRGYVHRLVGGDQRFIALGQVLRRDGLGVLVMIRLCPLPYSLSNGFLATVGSIGVGQFALATAGATPKLLVHVFIGSRLALLAEPGDKMSGFDRAVNYISMAVFGLLGFAVGVFIYRRTMARAAELAREAQLEAGEALLDGDGDLEQGVMGDDLENGRMVDPDELDAAALMDDDDISLWDASGDGYHDSWDDEPVGNGFGSNGHGSEGINGAKK